MNHLFKEIYKQYFLIGQLGRKQFIINPPIYRGSSGYSRHIVLDLTSDWDVEVFADANLQNA